MILTVIYQISHRVVFEGIVCLLNAEGYLSLLVFCAGIAFYTDELVAVEEVFILENFIAIVAFETPYVPVQVVMHVTLDPGGIMKPLRRGRSGFIIENVILSVDFCFSIAGKPLLLAQCLPSGQSADYFSKCFNTSSLNSSSTWVMSPSLIWFKYSFPQYFRLP